MTRSCRCASSSGARFNGRSARRRAASAKPPSCSVSVEPPSTVASRHWICRRTWPEGRMGQNSRPPPAPDSLTSVSPSLNPEKLSFAPDPSERFKRSLPPELVEELDKLGVDPQCAPSPQQWLELLPRLAGLIRARSFGRDGVALSHELRTPMTVVIGATELLLESRLDAQQRATVEGVRSSGQELLSILNQVLDEP